MFHLCNTGEFNSYVLHVYNMCFTPVSNTHVTYLYFYTYNTPKPICITGVAQL